MRSRLTINDRNLDKVVEAVDRIGSTLSTFILEEWKINIEAMGNVDTRSYINSIGVQKISNGEYRIFSDEEYSVFVEYGSGPAVGNAGYTPPFQPILEWVERRLGYEGEEAKAVAWYIVMSIEKNGLEPNPAARTALGSVSAKALSVGKLIISEVM